MGRAVPGSIVVSWKFLKQRSEITLLIRIERLLREHVAGQADHHVRLWLILNAEMWYRLFILGESRAELAARLAEQVAAAGQRKAPVGRP